MKRNTLFRVDFSSFGGYCVSKRSRPGIYLEWIGGTMSLADAQRRCKELNDKYDKGE
jgi:hypothetical protein